jgi:peptidoglycan/xylan/chitin deacetylase (PgdA/CDA1 family)
MANRKKVTLISNLCIALVLLGLGAAIFTADITNLFISVSAPITNGNADGGKVSLVFVVEDDARYLDETLAFLKNTNTPATFFIGGDWASKHRDKVIAISREFEIGNHAYNNKSLAKLNEKTQYSEIASCHTLVKTITSATEVPVGAGGQVGEFQQNPGVTMNLLLPPNNSFNKSTLKCADGLGYRTILCSRDATNGIIFDKAVGGISGGEFVLLKPSLSPYAALTSILSAYSARNLEVVSVGRNLA